MTIEQDSLEVDRKVLQPKPKASNHRFEKSMSMLEKKTDPYLLPQRLNGDSALANPIKEFGEQDMTAEFKPKLDLKNGVKVKEIRRLEGRYNLGSKEAPRTNKFKGPQARKPSNTASCGVYSNKQNTRRPSHATENQKSTIENRRTLSSREHSDDSLTVDFDKMDRVREQEEKEYEK